MKQCYGTIYPDPLNFRFNQENKSKIFMARINCMGAGHRDVHFDIDHPAWDQCQNCELFRSCFDFSTAKFVMQAALRTF